MPYTKPLTPEPWVRMRRLLVGYGMTGPKLAVILGVSRPTAKARIDAPGKLTLEELNKISRQGHIPLDELRDCIGR